MSDNNRAWVPESVHHSNQNDATCTNCHQRIGRSHRHGPWFHWANGSIYCTGRPEATDERKDTP